MKVKITPHSLCGRVTAPQSKSYAHRCIIAAALCGGKVSFVPCDDTLATLNGLAAMGFGYKKEGNVYDFCVSASSKPNARCVVDCNESGSTLRFLLPLAAALGINAQFVGKGRLFSRPMEGLTACLESGGTTITDGKVCGRLRGGVYNVDATVSSQFVSGLLMALPLLEEDSTLNLIGQAVSKPYIEITLDVLKQSGIAVEETPCGYRIKGGQHYAAKQATVQGDWSAAAFWLTAGALGGKITVDGLTRDRQGDSVISDVLCTAGAEVTAKGGISAKGGKLSGFCVNLEQAPDLAPIVSVLAAYAGTKSLITGLGRLAAKESNRLVAICNMLNEAGVKTNCTDCSIEVYPSAVHGGNFDGAKDHRMVMAAAVLAAFAKGESTVSDMECVGKSYPQFWQDFAALGGVYEVER